MGAYIAIKNNKKEMHKKLMLTALFASISFLVLYLIYHYTTGHKEFPKEGFIKYVYLTILTSHIILAAIILPLIVKVVYHAIKEDFEYHKKWAKWTLPIWMYVSVTGVLIYFLLYQF